MSRMFRVLVLCLVVVAAGLSAGCHSAKPPEGSASPTGGVKPPDNPQDEKNSIGPTTTNAPGSEGK